MLNIKLLVMHKLQSYNLNGDLNLLLEKTEIKIYFKESKSI